jgi:hypothetical protein
MSFETSLTRHAGPRVFTSSQFGLDNQTTGGWVSILKLVLPVNHHYIVFSKGYISNRDESATLYLDLSLFYLTSPAPEHGELGPAPTLETADVVSYFTLGQYNIPLSSDQSFTLIGAFDTKFVPFFENNSSTSGSYEVNTIHLGLRLLSQSYTAATNFMIKSYDILALQKS